MSRRLPTGPGCHGPSGNAGKTHREGVIEEKSPLVLFFDVSRAYDQVWHTKLLQKLHKMGISGKMYDYIKTFLSGRSMQIRWKGAMSAVKTVIWVSHRVLSLCHYSSPSWSTYWEGGHNHVRRWLGYMVGHTHPASVPGEEHCSQEVREFVSGSRVVRFMRENGFTLSIPKTVFIPFHTNNLLKRKLHVRINDVCIFASKKVKYLRLEAIKWWMEQPASLFPVLCWILCPHLLLVSHAATDDAAVSTDDFLLLLFFFFFFTFLLLN